MSAIRVVARLQIKDGKAEEFASVVKRIVAEVSKESGTELYDWFVDQSTGDVRVVEIYRDSDAVVAHLNGEGAKLFPALFETADFVGIEFYGEMNAAAREATAPFGGTVFGAPSFSLG